jgi:ribokinase
MPALRIAVVGHVEHVTLGRVEGAIAPGDVVHLVEPRFVPAGGGGIAFAQLCRSDAEVLLFTAVGRDDAGRAVAERIAASPALVHVHAAVRDVDHPRVVVVIDGAGRRTIVVTGDPLQPRADDALPWREIASCDAAYFTGNDPGSLRLARAAARLVVAARREAAIRASSVVADVVVGSVADPRENRPFDAYEPAPGALVLTDGPRPVRIVRPGGVTFVDAPPSPDRVAGDYGAGDSFAAALTYFVAHGLPLEEACRRAGPFGTAVLHGIDPLETQATLRPPAA